VFLQTKLQDPTLLLNISYLILLAITPLITFLNTKFCRMIFGHNSILLSNSVLFFGKFRLSPTHFFYGIFRRCFDNDRIEMDASNRIRSWKKTLWSSLVVFVEYCSTRRAVRRPRSHRHRGEPSRNLQAFLPDTSEVHQPVLSIYWHGNQTAHHTNFIVLQKTTSINPISQSI